MNSSSTLLKNYRAPANADQLIILIQQKIKLIIASDGSKSSTKSGSGLIIADEEGGEILSGFNPDFRDITQINSHRANIYGVLSMFNILHEYCKFYKVTLESLI